MQLTSLIRDHTRTQCAAAAMSRVQQPPVNLLGLDDSEAHARRRRCHAAALLRFVMPTKLEPKVQSDNRTHKRRRSYVTLYRGRCMQQMSLVAAVPRLGGLCRSVSLNVHASREASSERPRVVRLVGRPGYR